MSERIVDEEFLRELEGDRRLRRAFDEELKQLEESVEKPESEIIKSPKGRLRTGLKRMLLRLLGPAVRPFINHQREVQRAHVKLLRELWAQADERLTAAEDRLLQAYVKTGESMATLRRDIDSGFDERIERARRHLAEEAKAAVRKEFEQRDSEAAAETRRLAIDLVSRADLIAGRLDGEIEALRRDFDLLAGSSGKRLESCEIEVARMQQQLEQVRERTRLLARELSTAAGSDKALHSEGENGELLTDAEYMAHQDRFRGSHEEIARRQRIYIEYFRGCGPVLDVGCGRGEFLELLNGEGIGSYGIDTNEQMVKACAERGLNAEVADLFNHIQGLEDGLLGGIFAAQVVEHLDGPRLRGFLREAHRTLRDGGVLIAETVNPESVYALTRFYYLDAGHQAPLPPALLQFLAELAGFSSVEVKLLAELPEEEMLQPLDPGIGLPPALEAAFSRLNADIERLNRFLYGHMEYAIIARK